MNHVAGQALWENQCWSWWMQQKDSSCPGIMHHLWLFQHPLNLYRILSSSSLVRLGPPRPPKKTTAFLCSLSLSLPYLRVSNLESGAGIMPNWLMLLLTWSVLLPSIFWCLLSVISEPDSCIPVTQSGTELDSTLLQGSPILVQTRIEVSLSNWLGTHLNK